MTEFLICCPTLGGILLYQLKAGLSRVAGGRRAPTCGAAFWLGGVSARLPAGLSRRACSEKRLQDEQVLLAGGPDPAGVDSKVAAGRAAPGPAAEVNVCAGEGWFSPR